MMYDINRLPDVIEIGKTGEHLFRPIQFNMRSWLAVLPEGVPSVILIRPGETSADSYIAATEFDDGILTWRPTAADVENDGYGHIEVWLEQAAEDPEDTDPTGKSASARTHIEKSIGPAESDPPEAQASWLAQMTALKVATVDAAEDAEDAQEAAEAAQAAAEAAAETYPYIDEDTGNWMVWDVESGEYVDTGVKGHPDVVRVQDAEPTDADGMIWFPETPPASVTVPTVAEMNTALAGKLDADEKGAANGVAELDSGGKVPASQLPGFVDDVVEYASASAFPATGESGKIYVALDTNKTYRWSGSAYVEISASLALGETDSTAYRGDRGAAAYAAAVTNVESSPTSGSNNLVTSGGVYTAVSGKYTKPAGGIPDTDMSSDVQASLGLADTAYQKPAGGIPAEDIADGVIPDPEDLIDDAAGEGDTDKVWSADKLDGEFSDVNTAISELTNALPTEETAQELLENEFYNTGLTDTVLAVIGMIFNNLPQDEPAIDIVNSLSLECERLNAIYENWMSERSA